MPDYQPYKSTGSSPPLESQTPKQPKGEDPRACAACGLDKEEEENMLDMAKHNASMLLYVMGPCYFVLSILMIGVSFFLIFMMVTGRDHGQWWFIALEAMITATIVVEVTLQIVSQTNRGGSDFFKNDWNKFDFCVMLLCLFSFIVYAFPESDTAKRESDVPSLVILVIRYVAQCARLVLMIRRALHEAHVLENAAREASDLKHDGPDGDSRGWTKETDDEEKLFLLPSERRRTGPSELVAAAQLEEDEERTVLNQ